MFAHKSQYRILTLLLMLVAGIGVLAQNSLVLINPGTQIERSEEHTSELQSQR